MFKKDIFLKARGYYRRFLGLSLRFRYVFVLLAFVILSIALFVGSRTEREFMAGTEEGRFTIFVELEPGAKLDVTDMMVKEID